MTPLIEWVPPMYSGRTKVDSTIIVWRVHGRIQSPSLVSNNYKYDSSVGWPVHSLQSLYYTYPFSCVNSCLRNWHASSQMCSMYSAIMTVTWRGGCRLLWPFELYKRFKQSALKRTFPDGWLTRKRFYKAVISQHRRKGKVGEETGVHKKGQKPVLSTGFTSTKNATIDLMIHTVME